MNNNIKYNDQFIKNLREKTILPLIRKINNIPSINKFNLHIWWAKKPSNITSILINELSKENEIILDPFVGSGTTIYEALRLNRKVIGFDLSNLSVFIVSSIIHPNYSKINFIHLFNDLISKLLNNKYGVEKYSLPELYSTKCPICNKMTTFSYMVYEYESPIWLRFNCKHNNKIKNIKKIDLDEHDLKLIERIKNFKIPFWTPNVKLFENSRINVHTNCTIQNFFTKRNMIALSIINHEITQLESIPEKKLLFLIFSSIIRKCSRLIGIKGGLSIGYWIPKKGWKENNPIAQLIKAKNKILRNWDYLLSISSNSKPARNFNELLNNKNVLLKKLAIQQLDSIIPNNSIDLIISDPPYGDEVPYLELSTLWAAWLNLMPTESDLKYEIVISNSPQRPNKNPTTGQGIKNYQKSMELAFQKMSSKLKFGRFMCIWFRELELPIWNIMINAAIKSGLYFIEQTHIESRINSLKPKFTPYPTITGHVLAFFTKFPDQVNNSLIKPREIVPEINEVEGLIIDIARKIINSRGGSATSNELYTNEGLGGGGIISTLIRENLLDITAKNYSNLFEILKKEFHYNKSDGKWYLK
ncbi:MAG: DNA methyltransferase [Candidatus Helarchaeota archaeon]